MTLALIKHHWSLIGHGECVEGISHIHILFYLPPFLNLRQISIFGGNYSRLFDKPSALPIVQPTRS